MDFTGRNADQILQNELFNHSSWHFLQARSWLDYAQRTQIPSAIHYAAFELRYGIECLLYELLEVSDESLTEEKYKECIGDPNKMRKMLSKHGTNYRLLAEFSEAVLSIEYGSNFIHVWDIDLLFRFWGIASEFLHFVGSKILTYKDTNWLVKAYARLNTQLEAIWEPVTKTRGSGVIRPSSMVPEVHSAWIEFSNGALTKDDLLLRMKILQPAL